MFLICFDGWRYSISSPNYCPIFLSSSKLALPLLDHTDYLSVISYDYSSSHQPFTAVKKLISLCHVIEVKCTLSTRRENSSPSSLSVICMCNYWLTLTQQSRVTATDFPVLMQEGKCKFNVCSVLCC